MKTDNKGISLLVVMAALVVVGFIGTSLIKMSFSDTLGGVLYSESGAARDAANSGITAAIHELNVDITVDPDALSEVLFRLNAYMDIDKPIPHGRDSAICYIKGSPTTWNYLTSDLSQGYRVYIDGFEFVNDYDCKLSLVSEGFSDGGGRATTVALYSIADLYRIPSSDWDDMSAIYFEDDVAIEFQAPIVVNGDCYFSSGTKFLTNATNSTFNGRFRLQSMPNSDPDMPFKGEYTINGNAYFGMSPDLYPAASVVDGSGTLPNDADTGSLIVNGKAGFKHGIWLQGHSGSGTTLAPNYLQVTEESYWMGWIGTFGWAYGYPASTFADLNGQMVTHNSAFPYNSTLLQNKGASNPNGSLTENYILNELGFSTSRCDLEIHPEIIPNSVIVEIDDGNSGTTDELTGRMLNNYPANWNGFAVIKCGSQVNMIDSSTIDPAHVVTNKVIILVPTSTTLQPSSVGAFAGRIPPVRIVRNLDGSINRAQSGHITVINTGGIVADFGGTDSFRGLIYTQSGQTTIGGACNAGADGLFGSLYASAGGTYTWHPKRLDNTGNGKNSITFDPTVLEDLDVYDADGNPFIEKAGDDCDTDPDPSAGELTADKIDPKFLSQAL